MRFKKGNRVIVSAVIDVMYLDNPETEQETWWKRAGHTLIHVPPKRVRVWQSEEEYRRKCLMRKTMFRVRGLVVGYTRRATGYYIPGRYDPIDSDPPYMQQEKRHLLVMVESTEKDQWVDPWLCLEEDLEIDKEK